MGTWLEDIIVAYNNLGGEAHYSKLYAEVEGIRSKNGDSWPKSARATIRKEIEAHSLDSENFRGKNVFYKARDVGAGVWGLIPEYLGTQKEEIVNIAYMSGLEGVAKERSYLAKSRNSNLVSQRKKIDNYTCQACGFFLQIGEHKYIIDVHHINPLGKSSDIVITKLDELVCLCPNCHRIAHTRNVKPLTVLEIKEVLQNEQN